MITQTQQTGRDMENNLFSVISCFFTFCIIRIIITKVIALGHFLLEINKLLVLHGFKLPYVIISSHGYQGYISNKPPLK